ncbi:MAG: DUF1573 domain-containing protein [Pseudomonadota bacterium]
MKMKRFGAVFLICFALLTTAALAREDGKPDPNKSLSPEIKIPDPIYEFPTIFEGKDVVHDFVVRNTGGSPLLIKEVETTCGCTTAFFTRQIDPGAEGTVSIRVKTDGYGGRTISKAATLVTNDPANGRSSVTMKGHVDFFAQIIPEQIKLRGESGTKISASVEIVPSIKYPFHIVGTHSETESHCTVKIETLPDKYLLRIENTMEKSGKYFDRILVDTDHAEKKQLVIRVQGDIIDPAPPG